MEQQKEMSSIIGLTVPQQLQQAADRWFDEKQ
jgi:hypothetical protein